MKYRHKTIFVASVLLSAAASAFAVEDTRPATEVRAEKACIGTIYAKLDSSHDGKLSRSEAAKANPLWSSNFKAVDTRATVL
jgi:hypothetical protein